MTTYTDWTLLWKVTYDSKIYYNCDECKSPIATICRIHPNYNYTVIETRNVHKNGKFVCIECLKTYNPYIDMDIMTVYRDVHLHTTVFGEIITMNTIIIYDYDQRYKIYMQNQLPNRKL